MKIQKKNWGGGVGLGDHGGCERRIEVFGGSGGGNVNAIMGVGVMWGMGDVNQE